MNEDVVASATEPARPVVHPLVEESFTPALYQTALGLLKVLERSVAGYLNRVRLLARETRIAVESYCARYPEEPGVELRTWELPSFSASVATALDFLRDQRWVDSGREKLTLGQDVRILAHCARVAISRVPVEDQVTAAQEANRILGMPAFGASRADEIERAVERSVKHPVKHPVEHPVEHPPSSRSSNVDQRLAMLTGMVTGLERRVLLLETRGDVLRSATNRRVLENFHGFKKFPGIDRLSEASVCSATGFSETEVALALRQLEDARYVEKAESGGWRLTQDGERECARWFDA